MFILDGNHAASSDRFRAVSDCFLQQSGLPFAQALSAEDIERAFLRREALFAQDDIFSTQTVLWAFLGQVLRDGKGTACASALQEIATYAQLRGEKVPCGDTGDYCRARAKLSKEALQDLTVSVAGRMEEDASASWLWHGLHAKLIDGFTFKMPDTQDNQEHFPQQKSQKPGTGFPTARACAVLSLATAALHNLRIGPCKGKQTGENALLREILDDSLKPQDVAVFDRYYCSFMMLAMLQLRGVHFCVRLHQLRRSDFRTGKRLGKCDHIVTWTRPPRPEWMEPEQYERIPLTMTLREIQFNVVVPGRRTETITIITSLTDPEQYPAEDIATLYGYRWNAELDIRSIKRSLGLDHLRCKSPAMIEVELWVTLLAYNLIRMLIATAAGAAGKKPRQLGFTLGCQAIMASWMPLALNFCQNVQELWQGMLKRLADNEVADRPGRIEPRAIKRREKSFPFMKASRQELRSKLLNA